VKKNVAFLPMLLAAMIVPFAAAHAQDSTKAANGTEISYSKQVEPFLYKFCVTCHNEDESHPSELYMDTYESLMKGGKHGKAVVPGNAKESLLYQKTGSEPPFGKVMPPPKKKERPTPEQLEMLRLWIDQGAKKN
jgi:hypothetical protein